MSSRLRILQLTQPFDGGVFEHVVRLSRGLARAGHEVVLCGPLDPAGAPEGTTVAPLAMERPVSPAADLRALAAYLRILRRVRPDVVHAHSSKAGAVARAGRALAPRTPVVYTPHGYAFAGYFESERERGGYRTIERALSPLASRTLCVCEAEARLARSVGPAGRVRVVHNGVEEPAESTPAPQIADLGEGPVIGVLALLRPGKGLETLIDAMPAVVARYPTASVVVAGEGEDRAALERRAADRGVRDRVHLIGMTAGPGPLLAGAQVLCSPSWAESFPLSLLEAMWFGLPIVATDVGGCAEAIVDGKSGLLVPPRDPAALAQALIRVLDDHDLAQRLGSTGRERVAQRFTTERMVAGTLGVLGEVCRLPCLDP